MAERAGEVGTLYRRMVRFGAKKRRLPPAIRRLIVDTKSEHPPMSLGDIANVCYARFGRRPSKHTIKRVLDEDPVPLKMVKRFVPYHEMGEPTELRMAVVSLHSRGWTPKSIAGYLRMHKSTVYRVLRRWAEEGEDGFQDKSHGRPPGVRKVTFKTIEAVRRLQENPELGEGRIHAALARMGMDLSPTTCGHILALNRGLYGYEKAKGGPRQKKAMPFAAPKLKRHRLGGRVYAVSVPENHLTS